MLLVKLTSQNINPYDQEIKMINNMPQQRTDQTETL
jgi:hypothetical protein